MRIEKRKSAASVSFFRQQAISLIFRLLPSGLPDRGQVPVRYNSALMADRYLSLVRRYLSLVRNDPATKVTGAIVLFLLRELLVELEELGDALAFGHGLDGEAVGSHHGAVVVLMGSAELHGHGQFVVEVCQ